ncbi:MAG: chromosome segregation protein SMC, partial [Dysgonomonas sp.]
LLSIEEYEELEKRYNFIDLQKEDLIVAKRKLEEIIIKLDVFFSESFEDTYSKLRVEFQNIFTELFGGGQADLVLTTPDDMLGTGIEIVAQPPGKKLQTISLLSGGEKSLTAISLLFAILRIKKLPFAILDEVEAALDEVNVKRYAKYIKVFSERTQFIVITHRQGTMETVDALYGITMQEKGVSTVVKVKLGEGEQYV